MSRTEQLIRRIETGMSTVEDAREVERIIRRLNDAEEELNWLVKNEPEIARLYGIEGWAIDEKH